MYERPALERPVLIAAFRGWNDGGQAATLAAGYLARLWDARKFADIDPELFVDFQATRPHVSLEEGSTRRIEWPENTFFRARIPGTNRDAVILIGVEPNYRWRTFTELVAELARDLGIELVVTLGALLADVPHTRPSPVTGRRVRSEARGRARAPALPLRGPDRDRRRPARLVPAERDPLGEPLGGGPALRLAGAEPARGAGLCERLSSLLGIDIDVAELAEAETSYVEQVSEAVLDRLRDRRLRRGARAARGLARLARGVGLAPVRRGSRERDHPLPARARRERRQPVVAEEKKLHPILRGTLKRLEEEQVLGPGETIVEQELGALRRLARRPVRDQRARALLPDVGRVATRRASWRSRSREVTSADASERRSPIKKRGVLRLGATGDAETVLEHIPGGQARAEELAGTILAAARRDGLELALGGVFGVSTASSAAGAGSAGTSWTASAAAPSPSA